jgi:hypothetical protein
MSADLPPPPIDPGGQAPPPPPDIPARGHRARIWIALIVAVAALTALAVIVVVSFGPSGGGVLFRDDFSSSTGSSRWLVASDETGSMGPSGGTYRIEVVDGGELQSIARLDAPESSVSVQVDGTMLRGTGGFSVLCVSEVPGSPGGITSSGDRGVYYDFYLSFAQGGYALFSSTERGGPLDAREDGAGVLREGSNRVVARCEGAGPGGGSSLTLSVNGQQVLSVVDPDGAETFRAVGLSLFSEDGPAAAAFDDVVVSSG